MKILVYGAGNIGRLYAAFLAQSGEDVSILARGSRLAQIRDHGIRLSAAATGERTEVRVNAVERLDAEDAYDLVLVVLPRNHLAEVLPVLAANRATPSVMFFGNNAAGPDELVEALGRDRVLLGFPGAAAIPTDGALRYVITSAREQPTTIGELDGAKSPRILAISEALQRAGFSVAICSNMDAWLKTHVAKIVPTGLALYMAGADTGRLAHTPDALVLMVRAIREGFQVLGALDIPLTPSNHRVLQWLPEPLLVVLMRRMVESDEMAVKVGHALHARKEMRTLDNEFRVLAGSTGVATPAWDRLRESLDLSAEPLADGASDLSLRWGAVWGCGLVLAVVFTVAVSSM